MPKYAWVGGYRAKVAAQVAGEELAKIERHHGCLVPAVVVEEARPKDSPIHPAFEWNNAAAAQLYREEQARNLIRSVHVLPAEEEAGGRREPCFVHVVDEEVGGHYTTLTKALSDDDLRAQVLAAAMAELKAFKKKYAHLKELAAVFAAADELTPENA